MFPVSLDPLATKVDTNFANMLRPHGSYGSLVDSSNGVFFSVGTFSTSSK
jgi:hypothetical protein